MRIYGFVLPKNKVFRYALRAIYGVGEYRARLICEDMKIEDSVRVKDLDDSHAVQLGKTIEKHGFVIGPDLQREINENIKRLQANGSLRGRRHLYGLPVNGQRTKSNAKSARRRKKVM
ncbi:30S ribosomal protein S13 [Candidatus Cytomitobacter indipagum]|uniref:30S ribosomal protein S13 n=1 Tax=Candidatus Cytomitobacter indipagum TaxID=2601575 RepID=A0A5C0UEV2_9PROT|nr:30S ribosomal protein S13 [Candidatus Cytomitobacter indipagum]QEK38247.1 30S ribosomal protein S13 [Candidatus Cytomitobacter indipagum]